MPPSKQEYSSLVAPESSDIMAQQSAYLSPVAEPLLSGKVLKRSLKLINNVSNYEKQSRQVGKEGDNDAVTSPSVSTGKSKKNVRLLRRGVQEVTKSIRKGEEGLVFLASDIYPLDIAAHIPGLCEEKDIPYGYLCSKKALGTAFRSKRPASVLMIVEPRVCKQLKAGESGIPDLFDKVGKGIRQANPYL